MFGHEIWRRGVRLHLPAPSAELIVYRQVERSGAGVMEFVIRCGCWLFGSWLVNAQGI